MEINISKEVENINVDENILKEINRAVNLIGKLYDVEDSEVSITLTDDENIHELNKNYRSIDRPTDVLSFAFRESDEPDIFFDNDSESDIKVDVLGDIIISAERAQSQAKEYGHSFLREMVFLTVHGMLHLLGYDHMEDEERREMEEEQKFVMSKLGIGRD